MEPLNDYVILHPETRIEKRTEGGLILPNAKDNFPKAKIIALPPNVEDERLKVGQTVRYEGGAGTLVEEEGIAYLVVREANLVYIV